jgi:glycosyltransferase involved in cell wall biosynthesis
VSSGTRPYPEIAWQVTTVAKQPFLMKRSFPIRVAYDAQAFLSPNGGTGKGVQLRNLLGPFADAFLGFATKGKNYGEHPLIQGGIGGYRVWQQVSLPVFLRRWKADYFLAPYNTAPLLIPRQTKLILVLHDGICLGSYVGNDLPGRIDHAYRHYLVTKAVLRAHVVLTVSEYSKRQILDRFPKADVRVIPCSIAPSWFDSESRKPIEDRDNYIFMVTASVPHKNTSGALRAYARYVSQTGESSAARLRIVGLSNATEKFIQEARDLKIERMVDFEPYVTDAELRDLYRRARAVLIPSFMEGFGIPLLEAMASGTPVASSNAGSLPEVGGAAPVYFDPKDVGAMALALTQVLTDTGLQQRMVEQGLRQAQQFHPTTVQCKVEEFWNGLANVASGDEQPAFFSSSRNGLVFDRSLNESHESPSTLATGRIGTKGSGSNRC